MSDPPHSNRWIPVMLGGTVLLLVMMAGGLGWWLHGARFAPQLPLGASSTMPNTASNVRYVIKVDVHGDVRRPGVVTVSSTARVGDAIRAAGGYRHKADSDQVNEAALVTDGQEVFVPAPASQHGPITQSMLSAPDGPLPATSPDASSTLPATSTSPDSPTINLNSATIPSLETLPDIGPSRASDILTYREQHGLFQSVSDLRHVRGIGPTIYSRISPFVYVGGTGH